jgi:hypothetical protein
MSMSERHSSVPERAKRAGKSQSVKGISGSDLSDTRRKDAVFAGLFAVGAAADRVSKGRHIDTAL